MSRSLSKPRWSQGWRSAALASTALSVVALAAPAALAATAAPPANSLPGNFTAVDGATATYTLQGSATNSAKIVVTPGTTASVLQWGIGTPSSGGTLAPSSGTSLPSGVTQNTGLSVGNGATVSIKGAGAVPLLLNDATGAASQIYGAITDDGTAPMYIANANGIIVGATGSITVDSGSADLGLIGDAQDSSTFGTNGTITVNGSTSGSGDVTVSNGATVSASNLLVAGNGAINVGAAPVAASPAQADVYVAAGYGFTTTDATSAVPTSVSPFGGGSSAVNLSAGTSQTSLQVAGLYAAGSSSNTGDATFTGKVDVAGTFENSGIADLSAATPTFSGAFVNSGKATVAGLTAASISNSGVLTDTTATLQTTGVAGATAGADITNSGVINEQGSTLDISAGHTTTAGATPGNFADTGVIKFTTAGQSTLQVNAANIQLAGAIQQTPAGASAPAALSGTNALASLGLTAQYKPKTGTTPNPVQGVVDIAGSYYADAPVVTGQAIRVLSGNVTDPRATGGQATFHVGTGAAVDPFQKNASLGYNLSLFPSTVVEANTVSLVGSQATSSVPGSNMNLDGVVSTQVPQAAANSGLIEVQANNINGDNAGGFAVNDGDVVDLAFSGNINNPYGAVDAGSSAFQYNYVPVSVANSSAGKAGTVSLNLVGPSQPASTKAQFVNVLVAGNVDLTNNSQVTLNPASDNAGSLPALTAASGPTPPLNGSGGVDTSNGVATATPITPAGSYVNNHLVVQATGNILTGPSGSTQALYWPGLVYLNTVASTADPTTLSTGGSITLDGNLSNLLPAFSGGGTGIFFETSNLVLGSNQVSTSNDSWVNFASATQSSAYATTLAGQFFGGYKDQVTSTVTELGIQLLPSADFQPK